MSLQTDFEMETEGENKMERKHAVGFAVLEIAYWCFHAAFGGFISAYLLEHGMTSSALSLISAAYLLCSFAGSFVFGGLCDRLQTNRKVFIAGVFLTAALACGIFFGVGSVPAIAVLYPLFGFVSQPMGSNMDAWLLQKGYAHLRKDPRDALHALLLRCHALWPADRRVWLSMHALWRRVLPRADLGRRICSAGYDRHGAHKTHRPRGRCA